MAHEGGFVRVIVRAESEDGYVFQWTEQLALDAPVQQLAGEWAKAHGISVSAVGFDQAYGSEIDLSKTPSALGWSRAQVVHLKAFPLEEHCEEQLEDEPQEESIARDCIPSTVNEEEHAERAGLGDPTEKHSEVAGLSVPAEKHADPAGLGDPASQPTEKHAELAGLGDPAEKNVELAELGDPTEKHAEFAGLGDPADKHAELADPGDPAEKHVEVAGLGDPAEKHAKVAGLGDPAEKDAEVAGLCDPAKKHAEPAGLGDPAEKHAELAGLGDPAEKLAELADLGDPAEEPPLAALADPEVSEVQANSDKSLAEDILPEIGTSIQDGLTVDTPKATHAERHERSTKKREKIKAKASETLSGSSTKSAAAGRGLCSTKGTGGGASAASSAAATAGPASDPGATPASHEQVAFEKANPKKRGSNAWERYEKYKTARTVGEALNLGAQRGDILHDFRRGFLKRKQGGRGKAT